MATNLQHPLILFPADNAIINTLRTQNDVLDQFRYITYTSEDDWISLLNEHDCQVAVVQVNTPPDAAQKQKLSQHIIDSTELIFLSDGEPNPFTDQLMRQGAGYHFRAPVDIQAISDCLQDIYEDCLETRSQTENTRTSDLDQFGLLSGSSRIMHKLYRTIRKVARSSINVLIIGESGTGKELVANTVHMFSEYKDGPFVALNCGALSPELIDSQLFGHVRGAFTGAEQDHSGVFEQANGGTLFLDEVTEMPIEQQVKLLRVLETGEYQPIGSTKIQKCDLRVVAATNRAPAEAIEQGLFREDLFFRLSQFPVTVPSLRNRNGDVTGLAKHFLAYKNASEQSDKQIDQSALAKISQHHWPGNVRELKHTMERAYILSDKVITEEHILLEDLDSAGGINVPAGVPLEELEKQAIVNTLEENDGNKTETAEQLGVSVKTLYNKLEKYQNSKK